MGSRKKKGKELEFNLSDEMVEVLLNCNEPLPCTKKLLQDKPHLGLLKIAEIDETLRELYTFVPTLSDLVISAAPEEKEKYTLLTTAVSSFIKLAIQILPNHDFILRIVGSLSNLLAIKTVCTKLKAEVATLCENLCERTEHFVTKDKAVAIAIHTVDYLLDLTLSEEKNAKKCDIKRVWALRKFLEDVEILEVRFSSLLERFLSTATNPSYLRCREGQHVIGFIMSRDVSIAKKMHRRILKFTLNITKQLASNYGTVYFVAWSMADETVQKEIEDCIQNLMVKVLSIPRFGLDMPKHGTNVLAILYALHEKRNQKSFSHVLNNLYTPTLWRNLRSDNPWERCNAAQVFFDVFPLEKPYSTAPENCAYMERQYNQIIDLLQDDSHFVRVISIKGMCASLTTSLTIFSVRQLREICRVIFDDLPCDGSSYLVRRAVFEGLEVILEGPPDAAPGTPNPCQAILEPLFTCLSKSFYDENEKVRKAFVRFLIKIKEKKSILNGQFWDIVPLKNIVRALADEGPYVGEELSKLIKDECFKDGQSVNRTIQRACKLLDISPEGARNFFRYSRNVFTPHAAYHLIITMIGMIRKHLKEYLDYLNRENGSARGKSKSARKGSLEDISNADIEEETSDHDSTVSSAPPSSPEPPKLKEAYIRFLENPRYVGGVIQLATIVWVVFRNELNKREEYMENLYSLACFSVPMLLKHYKGTSVYYATVSFASLIPISKLRPVSTISSACISELKTVTDSTEESKLQCLIYSLCSWNRGHDILELANEWCNFALREQNLNNTAMTKAGQKRSRVRFQQTDGKPLLALKLLDILFSDVINETRLITNNYEQLHEFYVCLERITIILERRLADPESFTKAVTSLTDEFIYRAYCRYLRFMQTLHRPDVRNVKDTLPPFDVAIALFNAISWASSTLYQHIPEKEDDNPGKEQTIPLAVNCCLAVLSESTVAVNLSTTNKEHCTSLCLFVNELLNKSGVSWFLESAVYVIQAVAEYAHCYTPNNEWLMLSDVLPALLEKVLAIITDLDISEEAAKGIFKDISKFRTALFTLPKILLELYGNKNPLFLDVFRNLVHTSIVLLEQEINDEDEVIFRTKLDEHPYFASFIIKYILIKTVFSNQIIPAIMYHMQNFSQDKYKFLGCLSILYTLIYAAKQRLNVLQLEEALQTAHLIVIGYDSNQNPVEDKAADDSFSSNSCNIDVQKVAMSALKDLSQHLNCSLVQLPTSTAASRPQPVTTATKRPPASRTAEPLTPATATKSAPATATKSAPATATKQPLATTAAVPSTPTTATKRPLATIADEPSTPTTATKRLLATTANEPASEVQTP